MPRGRKKPQGFFFGSFVSDPVPKSDHLKDLVSVVNLVLMSDTEQIKQCRVMRLKITSLIYNLVLIKSKYRP